MIGLELLAIAWQGGKALQGNEVQLPYSAFPPYQPNTQTGQLSVIILLRAGVDRYRVTGLGGQAD
jgi:hypothetical protein